MLKDHNKVVRGELPKTRKVVSRYKGMGVHLSNGASEIVEALANSYPEELGSYKH